MRSYNWRKVRFKYNDGIMRKLILMLVVLLGSFANAQLPTIGWSGHNVENGQQYSINGVHYTVPQLEFRQELASLRNGNFDWSWAIDQIVFDPRTESSHRSDFPVTLTRNGQSGTVTVTVDRAINYNASAFSFSPGSSRTYINDHEGSLADVRIAARAWVQAQGSGTATILRRGQITYSANINGFDVNGTRVRAVPNQISFVETISFNEPDTYHWTYHVENSTNPATTLVTDAIWDMDPVPSIPFVGYDNEEFVTVARELQRTVVGERDTTTPEVVSGIKRFPNANWDRPTVCTTVDDAWLPELYRVLNGGSGNNTVQPGVTSTSGVGLYNIYEIDGEFNYRAANGITYLIQVYQDFRINQVGRNVAEHRSFSPCIEEMFTWLEDRN